MKTVTLTLQAEQDIRDIVTFIRKKNATAARQLAQAFEEQCFMLA